MRVFLSRVVALLATILLWTWFVCKFLLDWIGRSTAVDDFNQLVERLPAMVAWLVATPWWVPGSLAASLTAFLMWAGWPTDGARRVSRKEANYRDLGVRAMRIAAEIEHFQRVGKWVGGNASLGPEIYAVMVRFHDMGFDVPKASAHPDQDVTLNQALAFLGMMGPLLRDGSITEARLAAREMAAETLPPTHEDRA